MKIRDMSKFATTLLSIAPLVIAAPGAVTTLDEIAAAMDKGRLNSVAFRFKTRPVAAPAPAA